VELKQQPLLMAYKLATGSQPVSECKI